MTAHGDRTRRLILLRHAKASQDHSGADELRALTEVGHRQSRHVGASLDEAGLVPELALVSSAVRTRETWSVLSESFDPVPEEDVRDELYTAGVGALAEAVRTLDERVRTVLVVGHEPTMSAATRWFADAGSEPAAVDRVDLGMPTATYSVLELDGAWASAGESSARLVDVVVAPKS